MVGQPHVRGERDARLAVGALGGEVGLVELGRLPQRRTDLLVTPDDLLLLHERRAVPDLDVHPDPPGHEVRPTGHPPGRPGHVRRRDPHVLVERRGVLRLDVGRAVLEPEHVARRRLGLRRRRGAAEPELAPAHRDHPEAHPHQVAHGVHRHLRVVGAGLDDDVATGARRVEVVAEEAGQLAQRLGPPVGQPEPVVEQARAVADRHGEVTRREVERLTGVLRHVPRPPADDAAGCRLGAQRHPLGRRGPPGEQVAQRVAVVGDDVERHEVQPVLGRRGDAGLPLTAEGHDAVVGGIRLRRPGAPAGPAA